ncbi:MAG: universal stress protein [Kiritimatiellae bacterium]|nr:universal stress protein [Kiritimatiellia bacterium]MDD5522520.1 universal stress protein [Kiritimatiellia bacterium]
MKDFKKILCPTDFSEASYQAVKMANDLAEHFSAQLILVHVVQPVTPLPDVEMVRSFDIRLYEDQLRKGMENKLADVSRKMISKAVQVQSKTLCCGDPARMICDLVESENVDLIVIATHGMTGWRHYAQGSVAQKVIQHTKRPVLLVHGLPPNGEPVAQLTRTASEGDPGLLALGVIP